MPDERDADDLMTTAQVAARFAVTRHTVARWVRLGQLPAVKTPGGTLRIRRQDVEKLLLDQGES